jgi:hypothetical protein
MNSLHMPSVLKAGGAAGAIAIIAGLLTLIPAVGQFIGICFFCGGFLIPIAAGMAYGYFAPGQEETTQSAIGGALAGGVSGIVLGIFFAISNSITGGIQEGLGAGLLSGTFSFVICSGVLGVLGFVFGALGGLAWPLIQGQMSK